jgi:hypothetical protein
VSRQNNSYPDARITAPVGTTGESVTAPRLPLTSPSSQMDKKEKARI